MKSICYAMVVQLFSSLGPRIFLPQDPGAKKPLLAIILITNSQFLFLANTYPEATNYQSKVMSSLDLVSIITIIKKVIMQKKRRILFSLPYTIFYDSATSRKSYSSPAI